MKQREIIVEHKYIDGKIEHCFDDENYNLLELERKVYLNENERLNNIINELEKWLEENIKLKPLQTTYFFNCDGKQRSISEIELKELKRVFDKLQELKGGEN